MRQVLLIQFHMSDGTSLIAEVHQRGPMGIVDVIVPNTPEVEAMILMMNCHFLAYYYHYLSGNGVDKVFVKTSFARLVALHLLDRSMNAPGMPKRSLSLQHLRWKKKPGYKNWRTRLGIRMSLGNTW